MNSLKIFIILYCAIFSAQSVEKQDTFQEQNNSCLGKTVITSGVFDLFHVGHLNILEKAKALGNRLVVGVAADELTKTFKRKNPIIAQEDRKRIIQALKVVDEAFVQDVGGSLFHEFISKYNASIFVKGDDWKGRYGAKFGAAEVVYFPYTQGVSTTGLVRKIREGNYQEPLELQEKETPQEKETLKEKEAPIEGSDKTYQGKTVITFGAFDLFHVGHLNILEKAKSLGDRLVVGVTSDEIIISEKKKHPIIPQDQRARIIKALKVVDEVFIDDAKEDDLYDFIKRYQATIFVKGDDWKGHYDGKFGSTEVIYFPYTKGVSTTEIVKKIKKDEI